MPTAFVATYGSGQPVIGILAEFDALPGLSQDSVPDRKIKVEGGPGHACGHHLFGTASVAAAVTLKDWLIKNNKAGTVKLFSTPAEEGGSAKVYMVRDGLFNDVDAVLHWTTCPTATELRAQDLHGLWRMALWPEGGSESAPASTGAMLLGPHPEYPGSVRGRLRRSGPGADLEAEVAGDVGDDGEFNLDESADGPAMDALWNGQPSDCGRTIRGQRRPTEGRPDAGPALQFLLQRAPAGH